VSSTEASLLEDSPTRRPFVKDQDDLQVWIQNIGNFPPSEEIHTRLESGGPEPLPRLASYADFIPEFNAYRWLLSELHVEQEFSSPNPNMKDQIGLQVLETLRSQEALRKISRRRPMPVTQLTFNMHWDLKKYIDYLGLSPSRDTWEKVLCLTGSRYDAQAVTVAGYLRKTWPITGEHLQRLLLELLRLPDGQECSCTYVRRNLFFY